MPWMSNEEVNYIENVVLGDIAGDTTLRGKDVLEWGAGTSTKRFSRLANSYRSIEHDRTYYENVISMEPDAFVYHIPPTIPFQKKQNCCFVKAANWNELKSSQAYNTFKDYINYPVHFNMRFDVILVDGRARPECCAVAHDFLLRDECILLVHDYTEPGRDYYGVIEEKFKLVEIVDTMGVFTAIAGPAGFKVQQR